MTDTLTDSKGKCPDRMTPEQSAALIEALENGGAFASSTPQSVLRPIECLWYIGDDSPGYPRPVYLSPAGRIVAEQCREIGRLEAQLLARDAVAASMGFAFERCEARERELEAQAEKHKRHYRSLNAVADAYEARERELVAAWCEAQADRICECGGRISFHRLRFRWLDNYSQKREIEPWHRASRLLDHYAARIRSGDAPEWAWKK